MELQIDPDVKAVAEFMQQSVPAGKLVSVAGAVASLAPSFWGRYASEEVASLSLVNAPISPESKPEVSNG